MADDKPKKYKFEFDPWAECRGKDSESRKWAEGLVNVIKKIKFDATPKKALNERKWPEKKVLEEAYYPKPKMCVIMFTQHIVQLKDDKKVADKDKPKELKSLYAELVSDMEAEVKEWLEGIAEGKGESAKSLKDCKQAFDSVKSAKVDVMFKVPRERALGALEDLLKVVGKSGGKGDAKADVAEARSLVDEATEEFTEYGETVTNAIETVIKACKATGKNDSNDPALVKFTQSVLKQEGKLSGPLDDVKKFKKVMEDAKKLLEPDEVEATPLRDIIKRLKELTKLDKSADDAVKTAKGFEKEFKAIEGKIK